jgi:hypothetical protein
MSVKDMSQFRVSVSGGCGGGELLIVTCAPFWTLT